MRNLAGALAVFAAGAALRLPAFGRPLLSDDEAIYAVTADAMRRGDLLYRDVVDHKPPLIYHLYQAGYGLFGDYGTHGAHLFVLLAVLVTGLFLGRAAAAGGGARAGLAAAGLYLIFSTTWHDYDALAANCELFLLAPQAAAAWLLLRAHAPGTNNRRLLLLSAAAGVLVGISGLFKYQGFAFLGVGAALAAWRIHRQRLRWGPALGAVTVMTVAAALPPAVYLAWASARGGAEAALYWFRFNFSYVAAGLSGGEALARGLWRGAIIGGVAVVPYALGITGAVAAARRLLRLRRTPSAAEGDGCLEVLGLAWLLTGVIALGAGGRFFGHYFHLVLAPLCLLAAPGFMRLWDRSRPWRAVLVGLCLVPAALFFALATFARPLAERLDHRDPPYEDVAARIAAHSAPGDRVFVWGNSPQLYLLARRPMGTRFSFCNYVTGESPGTPTETGARDAQANSLADGWRMMFEDLESRAPVLFVDAAAAGWDGYDKYPVSRYPRLASYLGQRYQLLEEIRGVRLYRRRQP